MNISHLRYTPPQKKISARSAMYLFEGIEGEVGTQRAPGEVQGGSKKKTPFSKIAVSQLKPNRST